MSCRKVRDLCGKCGILTGATSGVGGALAKLLAEQECTGLSFQVAANHG